MLLSNCIVNAMNFQNSMVKLPQNNMGSSSFGLPVNNIISPMACFSESTLGSFKKAMANPLCKSFPLPEGICIASGAKTRLSFSQELPSLDTVIEEIVNTIEGMPIQTRPQMEFVNIGYLGVMDIPKAEPNVNRYHMNSPSTYSTNKGPEVTKVGMTYAQVTKLPPDPSKIMAKFPYCSPPMPSLTVTSMPMKSKECLKNCTDKRKTNKPVVMKNEIIDSPKAPVVQINAAQTLGQKRPRKGSKGRKKRGRKGKRELGGKGVQFRNDPDGSVWASQHDEPSTPLSHISPRDTPYPFAGPSQVSSLPESIMKPMARLPPCSLFCKPCPSRLAPPRLDSESSEEPPVPRPLARLRSLSDCSTGSLDSEDSFIVFESDGTTEAPANFSSDDSESEDSDEVDFISPNWRRGSFSSEDSCISPAKVLKSSPPSKRVRFSDEITVHPLVVWSCAQRLARAGPWEQMARDRARFANRIADVANVLNPILHPGHRDAVYSQRFVDH